MKTTKPLGVVVLHLFSVSSSSSVSSSLTSVPSASKVSSTLTSVPSFFSSLSSSLSRCSSIFSSFLICLSTVFLVQCTPARQEYLSSTREIISQGKWSVDYYFAGQNKTSSYYNYQFTFSGNGTVLCTENNNTYNGTWSMIRDIYNNDVLIININSQEPILIQLSQQWNVTDKSTFVVGMKDISNTELRFRKM